jgi:hypothetical protein
MKRFYTNETEKKEILLMHKSLMKEQVTTTAVDPDLQKLRDMVSNGCLKNGKIFKLKSNGKYIYRANNKSGKQVDFFADETYTVTDPTTKKQIKSGKFNCNSANASSASAAETKQQATTDIEREKTQGNWKERKDIVATDAEISSLYDKHPKYDLYRLRATTQISSGLDEKQKAFIKVWENKGYKLNLTPEERASGLFKPYAIEGSEGFFPAPGLKMWASAESLNDSSLTNDLTSSVAAQTMDKEDCKKAITNFYTAWKEGTTLPNLYLAKEKVQRCKSKFYKRWSKLGMFDGGNNLDNMLDILSGKGEKVPTLYGDDSKFKIQ